MNGFTLAPSEKHLEDWIVANPELVFDYEDRDLDDEYGPLLYIKKVVKRQVSLPAGICDLIALGDGFADLSLSVVELKKGGVDSRTVAQCLRYMRDIQQILWHIERPYHYRPSTVLDNSGGSTPEVTGLLIGHSLPDRNLLVACEVSHIHVLTYQYVPENQSYIFLSHPYNYARSQTYEEFAQGAIGDAMRQVVSDRHQRNIRMGLTK